MVKKTKNKNWISVIFSTWFFLTVLYGFIFQEIKKIKMEWIYQKSIDNGVVVISVLQRQYVGELVAFIFYTVIVILLGWWFYKSWSKFLGH